MTDSRKDAQSLPVWELTLPEIAYPIRVEMNSKEYEIFAVLKNPYPNQLLLDALEMVRGSYRRTASEIETMPGDETGYGKLTESVFMRFEGTDSKDPEVHRRFLNGNPKLKIKLSREGLGGIEVKKGALSELPTTAEQETELLPLALDVSRETVIATHQELLISGKKCDVQMSHVLRPETEADWRRFGRTSSERFSKPNNKWKDAINWSQRAELYDAMILRVNGMTIDGEACTGINISEWLPLVPFWHKILVIAQVFDEARVKNC